MLQSVRDLLTLRMRATENIIRLVWIVYLVTEVYTWLSWIWYSYPTVLHQGPGSVTATVVQLGQQIAYVAIVYLVLQLAKKFLIETQR